MLLFKGGRAAAVNSIAEKRVSDARHMNSYLMRAPRFKLAAHKCKAVEALKDLPMRHRVSASCRVRANDRHFFAVYRVSAYRRVNRSAVLAEVALRYRVIYSRNLMLLYLVG